MNDVILQHFIRLHGVLVAVREVAGIQRKFQARDILHKPQQLIRSCKRLYRAVKILQRHKNALFLSIRNQLF